MAEVGEGYQAEMRVLINLRENTLTVSDNGIGLPKVKFEQFLAPCFSFKSGNTRGHKGVGATYLAYGFNYIQIASKTVDYAVIGKMIGARKWLSDENPASNPKMMPDRGQLHDPEFENFDRGVSVTIKCDSNTRPGQLSWLNATNASQWMKILCLKTGIGAIFPNDQIKVTVEVTDPMGKVTQETKAGVAYLWPHGVVRKSKGLRELQRTTEKLFEKRGAGFQMPSSVSNLDAIFDTLAKV